MSFSLKLFLAMTLVVAGASVATLGVTQRRVKANYERLFRERFQQQVGYFTSLQDARLGSVREQCSKLAASPQVIAALTAKPFDAATLYDSAAGDIRAMVVDIRGDLTYTSVAAATRNRMVFRFLDEQGRPIPAPTVSRTKLPVLAPRPRVEAKLVFARDALSGGAAQQVGYVDIGRLTNSIRTGQLKGQRAAQRASERTNEVESAGLMEVIVTRILDPADNHMAGALLVGFPMPELVPQLKTPPASSREAVTDALRTGILFEDHFYASTNQINEAFQNEVGEIVSEEIQMGPRSRDEFDCAIQGEPFRVFYELLNEHSIFSPAYQVCLCSLAQSRREQKALALAVMGASAGAIGIAMLLCMLLANSLAVPLRELVRGTQAIQGGDFSVKVPVRSRDEVGRLAASFNDMAKGLADKERYRTLLNMVADEEVARQLMDGQITLGGEEREISVLFCDIRGFTALTQNMPPAAVIEMLNEHMTALTRVVKAHNGVLDKFVGDLLMAIFGAPVSHGTDALDAARCAVDLIKERQRLNESSNYKLNVGVGVATGRVVAGCMGSVDRLNYTVLGERVNLASRLCDSAGPGEVLVDAETASRLGTSGVLENRPALKLKGFDALVAAARLVEVRVG